MSERASECISASVSECMRACVRECVSDGGPGSLWICRNVILFNYLNHIIK